MVIDIKKLLGQVIGLLMGLFKKPTGVLPTITGGDDVLTPTLVLKEDTWANYISKPYEGQYYVFGDALDCVSQSGVHVIEVILNYFYQNKLFPVKEMNDLIEKGGYLNDQGYIELSVPYIARLAGTTKKGLAMDTFWNSVNFWGLVPKKYWNKDNAKTWEEYYADIPLEVKVAGQSFAKIFQWNWKVISNGFDSPNVSQVKELLKRAPGHFATCLCNRDYAGIFRYCGSKVFQHAMTLYGYDDYQLWLNQYDPYLQKAESVYPLGCLIFASLKIGK